MSPDGVTADQLATALTWIHFLGAVILGLGLVIYRQGRRIDRGCPSCAHCKQNRHDEEERARKERERLFGKDVSDDQEGK